ncbi:molybdopterin cofactor-binding domain-containing protein [Cupriavidus sp. 2KB_15]|uniref:xanthine dehydrogenase family protein molybdopterin-binding subunit n=1 Tax=Cupriavidus sp. 2KB_15 TaxID=3232976 RepID=UPI003F9252C7
MTQATMPRRHFLRATAALGGGLVIGFHLPASKAATTVADPADATSQGVEINAWLTIDPAGIVTIRVPHTEMGQGGMTSVALLIAEELEVDWSNIRCVFADANRHLRNNNEYIVMSTRGSQLVRLQHPHLMQAGASARERLKEAAAQAWGVPRSDVTAKLGVLTAGTRRGAYAEFASAAAAVKLDAAPALKPPSQWTLLGKPRQRLDIPHKVDGSAQYAIDTRIPGMAYAAVKACPVPWGSLKRYDARAAKNRPGVIAVVEMNAVPGKRDLPDLQNAVAVVAESWWQAKTALDLIEFDWDAGESGMASSAGYVTEGRKALGEKGLVSKEDPKALEVISASKKLVSATYERPFETHARMEPINATAHVQKDRVDVWSPTQEQSFAVLLAADQLKVDPKIVYAHTPFLGGGFGGNGAGGTAVTRQAVELSKRVGRPVKVIWSREEDIAQDKQRPMVLAQLSASVGDDGLPTALSTRAAWFTQDKADRVGPATADNTLVAMPYKFPYRHHERHNLSTHIPSATHRAPGANQMGFIGECFIDELAIAGGWNPLDWRIEMTKGLEDWQFVLNTLKERAGFRTDLPKGQGMGVAAVASYGTIAAACATVSVSKRGELSIEKVVIVLDAGHVINPLAGAEQAEGSVVWELSHAWFGGLELNNGRFTNTNFHNYNLMRMPQAPVVETHFASSGGNRWGGLGEPAGPPTPAAVANAIWYATGKRVRSTPFVRHDLSWR